MGRPALTVISQRLNCPFCEMKVERSVAFVSVPGLPVKSSTMWKRLKGAVVTAWAKRTRHAHGERSLQMWLESRGTWQHFPEPLPEQVQGVAD